MRKKTGRGLDADSQYCCKGNLVCFYLDDTEANYAAIAGGAVFSLRDGESQKCSAAPHIFVKKVHGKERYERLVLY